MIKRDLSNSTSPNQVFGVNESAFNECLRSAGWDWKWWWFERHNPFYAYPAPFTKTWESKSESHLQILYIQSVVRKTVQIMEFRRKKRKNGVSNISNLLTAQSALLPASRIYSVRRSSFSKWPYFCNISNCNFVNFYSRKKEAMIVFSLKQSWRTLTKSW